MFKDQSLKSKLALFAGFVFCSNLFISLPLRSASALAAWALTSNGSLKLRTSSGAKLDAFYQSSTTDKGERVWIDFPGELSRPRTIKGNGSVKEIRLGKPEKGKTRLVIEFLPSVELEPSKLKLIGISPNTWELKFIGLESNSFRSIEEGNILRNSIKRTYEKIKIENPIKERSKNTLNPTQKLFHFLQRAVASKGYLEAITWSFTDSKYNDHFKEANKEIKIVNPISSELGVLRNSIFSNLVMHMSKNLDRGIKDLSIFEIGPIFYGSQPEAQNTVVCGLSAGKKSRLSWIEKERNVDVFDIKRDVTQTLVEAGYNSEKFYIDDESPNYYHPGKSGRIFLNKGKDKVAAYFGEIHPNIIKTLDIKTESLVGFEIFLDNLKLPKKPLKDQKTKYSVSDFQKSERDFAFIVDKKISVQDLVSVISNIDKNLISNIKVFDVYEGDNIPENQKSVAISVTIQSLEKTLTDNDLEKTNNLIIETVENKTGAKIRS